jgi:hypothetical protein
VTYSEKKNSTIFINFTRIKQTSVLNINNVHGKKEKPNLIITSQKYLALTLLEERRI